MLTPIFDNTAKIIRYMSIWVIYAMLQISAFLPITKLPFSLLICDGFIHATVFGLLGVLLWFVLKYGNFQVLNLFQRILNQIVVGVLIVVLWLAAGIGLNYIFWGDSAIQPLISLLAPRAFIGILVYLIILQSFNFILNQDTDQNEGHEMEMQTETTPNEQLPAVEILDRIALKTGNKIQVVLVQDILFLQAEGDYVRIFTLEGKYLKEQTMKYFEEHLPYHQFVRVHRSVIVNVEMISRVDLYEKQTQRLTLRNGQQIKTSPSGYKALRNRLKL
jgi:hypothetical protein